MKNQTPQLILRCVVLIIALHVAEVVIALGGWYALTLHSQALVANKLGIGSSLAEFNRYVETHITVGMSRKEVITQAELIGPFRTKPFFLSDEYCETYYFNVGPLSTTLGLPWWVCYDDSDHVISVQPAGYQ